MSDSSVDQRQIQLLSIMMSINSNIIQLQSMIRRIIEKTGDAEDKVELLEELKQSFEKTDETFSKFDKYFDLAKKS